MVTYNLAFTSNPRSLARPTLDARLVGITIVVVLYLLLITGVGTGVVVLVIPAMPGCVDKGGESGLAPLHDCCTMYHISLEAHLEKEKEQGAAMTGGTYKLR